MKELKYWGKVAGVTILLLAAIILISAIVGFVIALVATLFLSILLMVMSPKMIWVMTVLFILFWGGRFVSKNLVRRDNENL